MLPRNTPALDSKKGLTRCFGCGPDNPIGLKLNFDWDGQTASATFIPGEWHEGWPGIVHGGIVSVVLDEAMTYVPYFKGIHCVTGRLEVRLKGHIKAGETFKVNAESTRLTRKLMECKSTLIRDDGQTVAEGKALYYIVTHWDLPGGAVSP